MCYIRGKRKLPPPLQYIPDSTKPLPSKRAKLTGLDRLSTHRQIDAHSLAWTSVGDEFGDLQIVRGVKVINNGGEICFQVEKQTTGLESPSIFAGECSDEESCAGFSDDVPGYTDALSMKSIISVTGTVNGNTCREEVEEGENTRDRHEMGHPNRPAGDVQRIVATSELNEPSSSEAYIPALALDQNVDMSKWTACNLSSSMLAAISYLGHVKPTSIQRESIPQILAGHDIIGKSQTGTGKTLAFAIPVIELWLKNTKIQKHTDEHHSLKVISIRPWAMILCPTRELAKQLDRHFKSLCENLDPTPQVCVITGGLSIQKQLRQLPRADIVIGTPGRLWQVLNSDKSLQDSFKRIRFLVADEADRLLHVGQFKEVAQILGAIDPGLTQARNEGHYGTSKAAETADSNDRRWQRQTLVFSATFDPGLQQRLAATGKASGVECDKDNMAYLMRCLKFRNRLKIIDVHPASHMTEGLRERLIECGTMEKDLFLYTVLLLEPDRRSLVFANSISAVRRLVPLMKNLNLITIPLHSQMAQKARMRSLELFAMSSSSVLIATDVAARGLDIYDVDQVIHYHVPRSAEVYIHRSGRTARGNRIGLSIILCSPSEVMPMRRLANRIHTESSSPQYGKPSSHRHIIHTLSLDRGIVSRLERRVDLAKRIADVGLLKNKIQKQGPWLQRMADELGVEHDSGDDVVMSGSRGGSRHLQARRAYTLTHEELAALKAQLRRELYRRVNLDIYKSYVSNC